VDVADPAADRATFPDADRVSTDLPSLAPPSGARPFAVVATMGERDEEAVLAALARDPAYLGVVASGKRFGQIRETLLARGTSAAMLARIKNPAGLDIGAQTPEEIAVSILAEIVQHHRADKGAETTLAAPPAEAVDPICGMTVTIATARYRSDAAGRTTYFCCLGCKETFERDPGRYVGGRA
jgi:xanthine dehydrogenase accessory factor